ncbi:hypothetical protein CDAR_46511 [Caerostris darwini]|uniref:Uncharacterized protein n=1 Tax=Caerostris darwini TaxID=1538125 RepID=A0AAV4S0S3_9ARAC|nr:hypothetical protein CDAR_46511 [Caerostris darwini]
MSLICAQERKKGKHLHIEAIWQNFARSERPQYCPKEQKEERIGKMKKDGKKRKVLLLVRFGHAPPGPASSQMNKGWIQISNAIISHANCLHPVCSGIHHNKTAIQSHSNNVKPSQRYKAYSSVSPKLLVSGLPPLYTPRHSPLRGAGMGVLSQEMFHFQSLSCP